MAIRYVVPIKAKFEDSLFTNQRKDLLSKLESEVVIDVTDWGIKPFDHVSDMVTEDLMDRTHDEIDPLIQQRLNLNCMDSFIYYSDGVDYDFGGIHPVH